VTLSHRMVCRRPDVDDFALAAVWPSAQSGLSLPDDRFGQCVSFVPTKPIYMVEQGFPVNGVSPSLVELRNVMYRSLIRGAAATLWWGTYHLQPSDVLWNNLKRCAGELRDLEPVIENGTVLGVRRLDLVTQQSFTSSNLVLGNSNLEGISYWFYWPDGHIDTYAVVANTSSSSTVTSTVAVVAGMRPETATKPACSLRPAPTATPGR